MGLNFNDKKRKTGDAASGLEIWFAEALDSGHRIKGEKGKNAVTMKPSFFLSRAFSALFCLFFFCVCCYPKKRGKLFLVFCHVYRFLSSSMASNAPTTIIATSKPITAGTKYRSAADCGAGVGSAVGAGASLA